MTELLKTNFELLKQFESYYDDGAPLLWSADGATLFCAQSDHVNCVSVATGNRVASLDLQGTECSSLGQSADGAQLFVAGRNLLVRQFACDTYQLVRFWKTFHRAAITSMAVDQSGTLLATGSTDLTLKVWDIVGHFCTHNFKGFNAPLGVMCFHQCGASLLLISASEDYVIRVHDLHTSQLVARLEGHFSRITALHMADECFYSSSHDKVVLRWSLPEQSPPAAAHFRRLATLPVFEAVLLLCRPRLPDASLLCTVSVSGNVRYWDPARGKLAQSFNVADKDSYELSHAFFNDTLNQLCLVCADYIGFYQLQSDCCRLQKQLVGNFGQIIDLCLFGSEMAVEKRHKKRSSASPAPSDTKVLLATNTDRLTMLDVATGDCRTQVAHRDIVMAVCCSGHLVATASKDNLVILWRLNDGTADSSSVSSPLVKIAEGHGHTMAVNCAVLSASTSEQKGILVSGSADSTLKVWSLKPDASATPAGSEQADTCAKLRCRLTSGGHTKEINCVALSPNDQLIASGSADKTVRLWTADTLTTVGVLQGHKRGVWSVNFSSVDKVIASGSADCLVKIWSLADMSCVKTFEGHESSVTRVRFLGRGMQLVSCGSDGLLKVWTIKSNECAATVEAHEARIWCFGVSGDEQVVVTGSEGGSLKLWQDVTERDRDRSQAECAAQADQQQLLHNLLHADQFAAALKLAVTLRRPANALTIVRRLVALAAAQHPDATSLNDLHFPQLSAVVKDFDSTALNILLDFVVRWNTNSRTALEAQVVLQAVLQEFTLDHLVESVPKLRSIVEGLLPYSERHFARLGRLKQQTCLLDYLWIMMNRTSEQQQSCD